MVLWWMPRGEKCQSRLAMDSPAETIQTLGAIFAFVGGFHGYRTEINAI